MNRRALARPPPNLLTLRHLRVETLPIREAHEPGGMIVSLTAPVTTARSLGTVAFGCAPTKAKTKTT